ncbi:ABC transporter substrate-binding protein [Mesonia mobilis]|uniref:ABC transporter substrate-binding protein n=1 Tax=Mesonia mobilis TaxID=369791 RepID=A0ABQ3BLM7_9FLAO|nr:ABC transporter substrate-binding protein [Mesonia mobilis]MBQ0739628.1 ABC transporter substrate-binding protein [Aquimarina celericrescens]GGZ50735.1 ABC transporter substrate-binding protein [Mesonia mobilis]
MKKIGFLFALILLFNCKEQSKNTSSKTSTHVKAETVEISYAEGFSITNFEDFKIVKVNSPWPKAEKEFTYVLAEKNVTLPDTLQFDQKVTIPINKIVVTSTTHIPSLESLGQENTLIGFPHLDYISSEKTRNLIQEGKVEEIGENEHINTEVLLNLNPDVVIGFAVEGGNKTFETVNKSGIPVVYNGDWTETDPLGKAEWIKFFGAFYNQEQKAEEIFNEIEEEYLSAKKLAQQAKNQPSVLAGSMYKDVWYLPYGNSWQAQFIKDAKANYLYAETTGNGSIAAAFESVLDKAQNADFWIAPGSFTSYEQMQNASEHYQEFNAFQQQKIYSFAGVKGETGGVLYYELAPQRPDLVLKDLIKIFHPELLNDYENTFFKALE